MSTDTSRRELSRRSATPLERALPALRPAALAAGAVGFVVREMTPMLS